MAEASTGDDVVVVTQDSPVPAQQPEVAEPEVVKESEDTKNGDDVSRETHENTESEVERIKRQSQRRIDKRTADYYREQARANQLAQEKEALEARLREFSTDEQQPQGNIDPQKLHQVISMQAKHIARMQIIGEKCNQVAVEGTKEFSDFPEKLAVVNLEVGNLFDQNQHPTETMQIILESDSPAKLLHYLGSNPDIASSLSGMTPTQLARKLDRIEREMSEKAKKQTSGAPKPITPVQGAAANTELHSGLSDEEWIRRREKQLKAEGRRV